MIRALYDALAELAADVGRPVLLEDRSHAVLAYSRHVGVTDQVREQTILGQQAPAAVRSWLARYRLDSEDGPVRLPANEELLMLPRLCLPVREGERLFGFLWFIEGREPLGQQMVDLARSRLPGLVHLLRAQRLPSRAQLASVLRKALAGAELEPDEEELCAAAGFEPTDPVRVLAVAGAGPGAGADSQPWPAVLESLARRAGAAVVAGVPEEETRAVVVAGLTREVEPPELGGGVGLGLGEEVPSVAHLRQAHRTAVDAATCAAVFEETGGFLDWSQAGMHRMVPLLARHQVDSPTVVELGPLLSDPRTAPLAQTATVYLDLAGNAQAAAAALHLHRTSLYYRLERFESLTGVDLREGTQRTAVHLALKVAAFREATAQP